MVELAPLRLALLQPYFVSALADPFVQFLLEFLEPGDKVRAFLFGHGVRLLDENVLRSRSKHPVAM